MRGGHQGRERIPRNFGPPTDDGPFRVRVHWVGSILTLPVAMRVTSSSATKALGLATRIPRNSGPPTDDEPLRYDFAAPLDT